MRSQSLVLIMTAILAMSGASRVCIDEECLPGSQVSVQEAARRSRLVVVATDIEMGPVGDIVFLGQIPYRRVSMQVVKTLKGEAAKALSPVRIVVRPSRNGGGETRPKKNREYVVFLDGSVPNALRAIKVLPATEDNLRTATEALKRVEP